MKIQKTVRSKLRDIERDLLQAKRYIKSDRTHFCVRTNNITTLDYTNKASGESLQIMNKDVGSDLCYLYNAIDSLNRLLIDAE